MSTSEENRANLVASCPGSAKLIHTSKYTYFVPDRDSILLRDLPRDDGWSLGLMDFFFDAVHRYYGVVDGTFVDVGANIGPTSIQALEHPGVDHVFAVEACLMNYACLRANLAINKVEHRVTAVHAVAGAQQGRITLNKHPLNSGDCRVAGIHLGEVDQPETWTKESVPMWTLDNLLTTYEIDDVAFLWMDVQGYETQVLQGTRLVQENLPTLIELWPYALANPDKLFAILSQNWAGYVVKSTPSSICKISGVPALYAKLLAESKDPARYGAHTDLFLIK